MIVAIWIVTALLVSLWSLFAWGLHGLLALVAGSGSGVDLKPLLEQVPQAELFERWFPGWREFALLLLETGQVVLGWLGGAVPLLTWLTWGVGSMLLLLTAAVLTLFVRLVRQAAPALRPAT